MNIRLRKPQILKFCILLLLLICACNLPFSSSSPEAVSRPGPTVSIQEPASGTRLNVGDSILFLATASDESGVVRLELWIDDTLALDQSSPDANGLSPLALTYPLAAVKSGTYTLIARAYNSQGDFGESVVHYVTVEEASGSKQEYAQYTVQPGDTLDSIAAKSGVSVQAILQANPHIAGGQVKPGQVILILMGPKQPAQAAVPGQAGGQPGGQPGNQPGQAGNQPGAQIRNLPGILPQLLPGQAQLNPSLFPDPMQALNLPNGASQVPVGPQLKAQASGGCKVDLTWTDTISGKSGYEIYRFNPGAPMALRVAQLPSNAYASTDNITQAGKYGYRVDAIKEEKAKTAVFPGTTVWVDVKSSSCQINPNGKRLFFQPLVFTPTDSSIQRGFLFVTLSGFTPLRIPKGGQDSYLVGSWGGPGEWAIPMPESVNVKPNEALSIEVVGTGKTGSGPKDLGKFINRHTFEILAQPDSRSTDRTGASDQFSLSYRLWLEEWQWGGKVSDSRLAIPVNVVMNTSDPSKRTITWDYAPEAKRLIDGFIVYGQYQCPGGDKEQHFVILGLSGGQGADQFLTIKHPQTEPIGCTCAYRVSAFSKNGESGLSDYANGPTCKTEESDVKYQAIFNIFEIQDRTPSAGAYHPGYSNIYLFVEEFMHESAPLLLEQNRKYTLSEVFFDRSLNNNRIVVPGAAPSGQAGAPAYSVSVGFQIKDLCQAQELITLTPNAPGKDFALSGNCGENCTCFLSGSVKALPPGTDASGVAPAGGAWKNIGETCSTNSECASDYCFSSTCTPTVKGGRGAACFANNQCASNVCQCTSEGKVIPCGPNPVPGILGACKGPDGSAFPNGTICKENSMCASGNCVNGVCAPKNGLGRVGDYCHHNDHCFNKYCLCPEGYNGDFCKDYMSLAVEPVLPVKDHGVCGQWPGLVNGQKCDNNDACASRYCTWGVCAPRDGTGLGGEYCFHNNHCASGICLSTNTCSY